MNNPLMQVVAGFKNGLNPLSVIQRMAGSDPKAAQAINMMQGKSPQQLQEMALNMCRERGTTPEDVLKELGLK